MGIQRDFSIVPGLGFLLFSSSLLCMCADNADDNVFLLLSTVFSSVIQLNSIKQTSLCRRRRNEKRHASVDGHIGREH